MTTASANLFDQQESNRRRSFWLVTGFLLLEAIAAPLPEPEAWEQLIGRLVAAVGDPTAFARSAGADTDQGD